MMATGGEDRGESRDIASDDDSSTPSEQEGDEHGMMDLPTDDSVSLDESCDSDSDTDDGSSSDTSDGDEVADVAQNDSDSSDGEESREEEQDDLPLEELRQRQRDAGRSHKTRRDARERKKLALKVASERLATYKEKTKDETQIPTDEKRKSKHAPTEVSSRRSAHRKAQSINSSGVGVEINAHRYKPRDPRLSSMSGHLQQDQFDHNYAFLQTVREKEMDTLKRHIAARKTAGRKGQKLRRKLGLTESGSLEHDQAELKRLQQEKASYERSQVERAAKQAVKRKIRDDVATGKSGVYYLKRREQKRLELEAKFEELRKRGGDKAVAKALAKRRKKNKSKDTGFMPKNL